uniref:CUB domain-containing protein n=1 Tax=Heliothis virescens TaxID=7102 RepID=A0A2A4KAL1_HELVI
MVESLQMFLFLFKSKYRRKCSWFSPFLCSVLIVLLFCDGVLSKCGDHTCVNGVCKNDMCVCYEGWQGPECQYCGGKVNLTSPTGYITDGPGNYSVSTQCSWLLTPPRLGPTPPPLRVRLESFATECGWDHLYVYDGDSVRAEKLLAVFSGVLENGESSWTRQVIARSGSALLHFFSDDAYAMEGFNVTYAAYSCPSNDHRTNCSNHGECEDGSCRCEPEWTGVACDQPLCPEECNAAYGGGTCTATGCVCSALRRGTSCARDAWRAGWAEARTGSAPPVAAHALLSYGDDLLRVGGETFAHSEFLYRYKTAEQEWEVVPTYESPAARFAHSAVLYGHELIVYGGVVISDEPERGGGLAGLEGRAGEVTNEIWRVRLNSERPQWHNATPVTCSPHRQPPLKHCGGLHVSGHTAVLVYLGATKKPVMLVFFGHSPHYGYLHLVQEYYVDEGVWSVAGTRGWAARAGFAHAAAWDPLSRRVYVHGGLVSESEATQVCVWSVAGTRGWAARAGFAHAAAWDPLSRRVYVHGGLVSESEATQVCVWSVAGTRGWAARAGFAHAAAWDPLSRRVYVHGGLVSESEATQVCVWSVAGTRGWAARAGFAHAAAWDPLSRRVYVHGGLVSESEATQVCVWSVAGTRGWAARAGFAHAAAWDPLSRRVYVHGGLVSESEATQVCVWSVAGTRGWAARAGFAHAAAWDPLSRRVYVHGGLVSESEATQVCVWSVAGTRGWAARAGFAHAAAWDPLSRRVYVHGGLVSESEATQVCVWSVAGTRGWAARAGFAHAAAWDPLSRRVYVHGGLVSESEATQVCVWSVAGTRGWAARAGFAHAAAWDPLSRRVYVHGGLVSESEATQVCVWSVAGTRGWAARAGFAHAAAWDPLSRRVYVHGGLVSESEATQAPSASLFEYDPELRLWRPLQSAPTPRYLHSATFITPGVMLVFGGNAHNDSAAALVSNPAASKCYSAGTLLYDVRCGTWSAAASLGGGARAAHAAAPISTKDRRAVLIHAGFDGRLRSDSLVFEAGEGCSRHTSEAACLTAAHHTAIACVWRQRDRACLPLEEVGWKESFDGTVKACLTEPRFGKDERRCSLASSCAACTAARCAWCGACHPSAMYCVRHTHQMALSIEECGSDSESPREACGRYHSCAACLAHQHHHTHGSEELSQRACFWDYDTIKCKPVNSSEDIRSVAAAGPCSAPCSTFQTCANCTAEECIWCASAGRCVDKNAYGASWHFTACPACQCNGHSVCDAQARCMQPCAGRTVGEHCDVCAAGHWGNPLNGGVCQPCECNAQAVACAPDTGRCYCSTKGLAGDRCDKCDNTNHYHADIYNKGACYYDLAVDYQFTFNLSKKEDRHLSAINFRNAPVKPDVDADFSITCSAHARMNLTVRTRTDPAERTLFSDVNCTNFRYKFAKSDHAFGVEDNVTLTTFFVYVYDFRPPLWIQISFSQYPKLNLQQFFITFSSCFLLLLLVAAALWKIKQKYDMYRRRQRLFVEMEQMASRPFSQVCVELEKGGAGSGVPAPVALEPCRSGRAAVLSLLVRLPTGGTGRAPPLGGLAVASALVTLGHHAPHAASVAKRPRHH